MLVFNWMYDYFLSLCSLLHVCISLFSFVYKFSSFGCKSVPSRVPSFYHQITPISLQYLHLRSLTRRGLHIQYSMEERDGEGGGRERMTGGVTLSVSVEKVWRDLPLSNPLLVGGVVLPDL